MTREEFAAAYAELIKETEKALMKQPGNVTGASIGIQTRQGSRHEVGHINYFDEVSFDVYKDHEEAENGLYANGKPAPAYIAYGEISVLFAAFVVADPKEE